MMTLETAYRHGKEALEMSGILDADTDAWILLEYVTGITRARYYLNPRQKMSEAEEKRYCSYIEKRKDRIPVQHLTGVQEFMGLEFLVDEHVLIPRQDTEVLVEKVLEDLEPGMRILDMCTGSGCILVSLMKRMENEKGEDTVHGVGVDISREALKVAWENAKKHKVDAVFLKSNLFDDVEGTYDVIVSNPPYIRTSVIEELQEEVKLHDPYEALDGKEDGLFFYRKIIEKSKEYLKKGGRLYFEIGHDQGDDVKKLMEDAGFAEVTVKKDLAGLDRVVFGV